MHRESDRRATFLWPKCPTNCQNQRLRLGASVCRRNMTASTPQKWQQRLRPPRSTESFSTDLSYFLHPNPAPGWQFTVLRNALPTKRSEEHTSELQSLTNLVC